MQAFLMFISTICMLVNLKPFVQFIIEPSNLILIVHDSAKVAVLHDGYLVAGCNLYDG